VIEECSRTTRRAVVQVEDWFEFENNGFDVAAHNDADLTRRTILYQGQPTFVLRLPLHAPQTVGQRGASANDYSQIFALIDAISRGEPDSPVIDLALFGTVADWEEWMRFFAIQRAVGNWDSYGWERGKNDYLYKPAGSASPLALGHRLQPGPGPPANARSLIQTTTRAAMFNTPAVVRAYWRAFATLFMGRSAMNISTRSSTRAPQRSQPTTSTSTGGRGGHEDVYRRATRVPARSTCHRGRPFAVEDRSASAHKQSPRHHGTARSR